MIFRPRGKISARIILNEALDALALAVSVGTKEL